MVVSGWGRGLFPQPEPCCPATASSRPLPAAGAKPGAAKPRTLGLEASFHHPEGSLRFSRIYHARSLLDPPSQFTAPQSPVYKPSDPLQPWPGPVWSSETALTPRQMCCPTCRGGRDSSQDEGPFSPLTLAASSPEGHQWYVSLALPRLGQPMAENPPGSGLLLCQAMRNCQSL